MWKSCGKIYKTRNKNIIITQVVNFPNINDTLEDNIRYYDIDKIQNDEIYRDIKAYFEIRHGGRDFIPYALQDRVPRLANLPTNGKGWFWCLGYISPVLENASDAIKSPSKRINVPSYDTLYNWLKHLNEVDCDDYCYIDDKLFLDALRSYINDNKPEEVSNGRKFNLLYNNRFIKKFTKKSEALQHLDNLKNRNWYEIIVNDFE